MTVRRDIADCAFLLKQNALFAHAEQASETLRACAHSTVILRMGLAHEWLVGCSPWPSRAAGASAEVKRTRRRTLKPLRDARTTLADGVNILRARYARNAGRVEGFIVASTPVTHVLLVSLTLHDRRKTS
jgi:hypothetical protein